MSQLLSLEPEDLAKRNKDLDLREALLNERERKLDAAEKEGRIAILDKQIEAKQEVIDGLNTKILTLDKRLDEKAESVKSRMSELDGLETSKKAALAKLDGKKAELEADLTLIKAQVDDLKSQIKEREDYLARQEQQVDEAVANWNDKLNQIKFELESAQKDLTRVLEDKIRIEAERDTIASSIAGWEQKAIDIEYAYNDKAAAYRDDLKNLDAQVTQRKNWLEEQRTVHTLKEKDLESREKSLEVQQVVNNRKERELQQKERKLKMDYNLAGMEWE